jgi:hypothetical protein
LRLCCTCLVCFSGIWNRSCLKILCNLSSGLAQLGCAWFSSWSAREVEESMAIWAAVWGCCSLLEVICL